MGDAGADEFMIETEWHEAIITHELPKNQDEIVRPRHKDTRPLLTHGYLVAADSHLLHEDNRLRNEDC